MSPSEVINQSIKFYENKLELVRCGMIPFSRGSIMYRNEFLKYSEICKELGELYKQKGDHYFSDDFAYDPDVSKEYVNKIQSYHYDYKLAQLDSIRRCTERVQDCDRFMSDPHFPVKAKGSFEETKATNLRTIEQNKKNIAIMDRLLSLTGFVPPVIDPEFLKQIDERSWLQKLFSNISK